MNISRTNTINGVRLPRRRFTAWAALYFMAFVCAPVLGIAFLLDRCYGVLCLLP